MTDAYLGKLGPDSNERRVFVRRDRPGEPWRLYDEPEASVARRRARRQDDYARTALTGDAVGAEN